MWVNICWMIAQTIQIDTYLCFGYSLITHSPELVFWRKGSLIFQPVSVNPEVSAEHTKCKTVASLCLCRFLCYDSLGQRDTARKVTLAFPRSTWTGWAIWQNGQVKYTPPPHKRLLRPLASTHTTSYFLVPNPLWLEINTCHLEPATFYKEIH